MRLSPIGGAGIDQVVMHGSFALIEVVFFNLVVIRPCSLIRFKIFGAPGSKGGVASSHGMVGS